jgi:predicted ester cyclase
MLWFGPGGIGSNRRLKGFQDFHQRPFLTAFPDRRGGNHKARVADAMYCASSGWPSITATHAGPYLGHPATGRRITMRVMDWWRREGDLLAENWIFIDLPDLFQQFGRDLFAEMRGKAEAR